MKHLRVYDETWLESNGVAERPEAFLHQLGGPAMVRLAGRDRTRTRALSALLHGNEPSGLMALHAWLRRGERPATDVLCFIGAVAAARLDPVFTHRLLPGGRDLNRCFLAPFEGYEGEVAGEAISLIHSARPEALVDLHNNSGRNPIYGLGPECDRWSLTLTSLFSRRFVHNPIRLGTLVEACHGHFPSTTIECGKAGDPSADAAALAGLRRYFETDRLEQVRLAHGFSLLETAVRVCLRPEVAFVFGKEPSPRVPLTLRDDLDLHNFGILAADQPVGWLTLATGWPFDARDTEGREISERLFRRQGDRILTREAMIPMMMTIDATAARNDCLCYLAQERTV